ncbi:bifunctional phosphoribosylaminoimidazolecarboxamide formyltransferase/IMP cyclohydrolase [Thermicanus aegyptius]|uniref:bifunctional phosphoribosylaminoimidazolecarboxamide formyltransferase/IMP cyclohydrolase n=1 Tax=Thermicanus aegyptius TaxID=94009 RepID=UPI000694DE0E|nr:bifunctional phosphoribosylaminoimidazolecarboxamide formyltransferase/IMP cyclohydrolase [Thermicanus aegyptius]
MLGILSRYEGGIPLSIKRALISVSDKRGIVEFAKFLQDRGIEIVSTGGTYRVLKENGIKATYISEVTGFPEILDGRVKTLHPHIHGGLLAKQDNPKHLEELKDLGIQPIGLLVVNLYPFQETIQKPGVSLEEAIENIDIGGPTMLRGAAKNYAHVAVVVDPDDYGRVMEEIRENGQVSDETREKLAAKVFRHTAAYDAHVARYLSERVCEPFPERLTITYEKVQDLRYGENPHQQAAFYRLPSPGKGSLPAAEQLQGKELSYNNIQDAEAALNLIKEFQEPAAVVVKHSNPCGVAVGSTVQEAFARAYEADPVSIFGGIVALNRPVDGKLAERLKGIFLEIILAPDFEDEAVKVLTAKKNLRLLKVGVSPEHEKEWKLTSVTGGLLIQSPDDGRVAREEMKVVTDRAPTEEEWADLLFAWKVVKHVKSNAIVVAKGGSTLGVGAGQMNRVGAARIALAEAGEKGKGAVLSSDAFFPMPDTVEEAAKAGITAIIQPGGSIKDQDSIDEANKHGIAMVFTGMRHFRH